MKGARDRAGLNHKAGQQVQGHNKDPRHATPAKELQADLSLNDRLEDLGQVVELHQREQE
jgi:hypothetical protein